MGKLCAAYRIQVNHRSRGAPATREGLWHRTLLSELGTGVGQIVVMCDNQSALKLMNNVSLSRTKHIDMLHHTCL
jgi:hypothetical protein